MFFYVLQQFVWNDFCEEYVPTDKKHTYYPSVITNDRWYEIKISDLPVIPYFPVNSYYEWTDYRFYGLRSSTAYILVRHAQIPPPKYPHKALRSQSEQGRRSEPPLPPPL